MGSTLPSQELSGTYSVFTGTDIYTVFQDMVISTLQGISYSITRQKAPIYTMGSADPRGFARSKRGIAGSMILTSFDRHCLSDFMRTSSFAAKKGSLETTSTNPYKAELGVSPSTLQSSIQTLNPSLVGSSIGLAAAGAVKSSAPDQMSELSTPMFTDQLMPFDITLMASNEYGTGAVMRVFGVEILNEGAGVSIDDTSNEVQMTYICRVISGWVPQKFTTSKEE
jgi:hypothetical protein